MIIALLSLYFCRLLLPSRRLGQPSGPLDGTRQRAEEAKALFEVSNSGTGKGVPLQRLRFQAKEVSDSICVLLSLMRSIFPISDGNLRGT